MVYYDPSGYECEDNTQTETNPKPIDGVAEGGSGTRVQPSHDPDILAEPTGRRTNINYSDSDVDNIRALIRENEAADTLAKQGYTVEQNPSVPGSKNPDYLIEGEIFDCYSPKDGTNVRNIVSGIQKKVDSGQTNRVILNLDDWHGGGGSINGIRIYSFTKR